MNILIPQWPQSLVQLSTFPFWTFIFITVLGKCQLQIWVSLRLKRLWFYKFLPKSWCVGHVTFRFSSVNYGKWPILWCQTPCNWEEQSRSQGQLLTIIVIITVAFVERLRPCPGTEPRFVLQHSTWSSQPLRGVYDHITPILQMGERKPRKVKSATQGPPLLCVRTSVQNQTSPPGPNP